MSMADLLAQEPALDAMALTPEEVSEVEAEVKYDGYVRRQMRDVERMRRMEEKRIAPSIDYARIVGLSSESRELLQARRPLSLGEASRIPGVTPADLNLVLVAMSRSGRSDR
jgi:tRNA uridine 5-carboxymethylaminomethyl modification enzyme